MSYSEDRLYVCHVLWLETYVKVQFIESCSIDIFVTQMRNSEVTYLFLTSYQMPAR